MWTRQKRRRWSPVRLALPLVTACVCAYFAHHAQHGANGWHARAERIETRDRLRDRVAELSSEREALGRRADLLNGSSIERDVLDERARDLLGLSRPDEIVVLLD